MGISTQYAPPSLTGDRRGLVAAGAWTLVGAAALGPFWNTYLTDRIGWLTLGRLALAVGLGLLLAGTLLAIRQVWLPPPAYLLFAASALLFAGVATTNAATRGCISCDGAWAGLVEVLGMLLAFSSAAVLVPAVRVPLIVTAVVGSLVGAALAVADVNSVRDIATAVMEDPGRLTGPYRNPNYLAFMLGCACPLLMAMGLRGATRGWRVAAFVAVGIAIGVLVASFSRGGIACAAAGILVTAAVSRGRRRAALRVMAVGVGGLVVVGALGATIFERERTETEYGEVRSHAAAIDVSGWDGTARGPIPAGPSSLSNWNARILSIDSDQAGEGISIPLGRVREGRRYEVTFRAASPAAFLPLHFRVRDDRTRSGGPEGQGGITNRWRHFKAGWRPTRQPRQARFYLWQSGGASRMYLSSVVLHHPDGRREALDVQLQGSLLSTRPDVYTDDAASSINTRREAMDLAVRAFWSSPVLGIGWQEFPGYAASRTDVKIGATHNEYLRVFAELGLLGAIAAAGMLAGVVCGLGRTWTDARRAGPLGALIAGCGGLLFVNALVSPATMLPMSVAVAVILAERGGGGEEHSVGD